MKLFISYSSLDENEARSLYKFLIKHKLDVWFDKESLLPGQNWTIEINKAIKKSDIFILLLSSNSVDRKGYFQKEMKIAKSVLDKLPDDHIYFLPIRIDNCSIPEDISNIHWIDLFPDSEFGLRKIINAIEFQKKKSKSIQEDPKSTVESGMEDDFVERENINASQSNAEKLKEVFFNEKNLLIDIIDSQHFKIFNDLETYYLDIHRGAHEIIITFQILNIGNRKLRIKQISAEYSQNMNDNSFFKFEEYKFMELCPNNSKVFHFKLFVNSLIQQNIKEVKLIFEYLLYDNRKWKKRFEIRYIKLIISDIKKGYLLVIDFGTCNSICAAIKDRNHLDCIDWKNPKDLYNKIIIDLGRIAERNRKIPSAIKYFIEENKDPGYTIGMEAKINYFSGDINCFCSLKKHLGDSSKKHIIFKEKSISEYSSNKLTFDYLTLLKKKIEEAYGYYFDNVIFTYPSNFSLSKLKSFDSIINKIMPQESQYELINKSIAKAMFYICQIKGKYRLMIYDFCRESIDITYLFVSNTSELVIELIDTDHVANFGGDNVTEAIAKILLNELKAEGSSGFIYKDNKWGKIYKDEAVSNYQRIWSFSDYLKDDIFQREYCSQEMPLLYIYNKVDDKIEQKHFRFSIQRNQIYKVIYSSIDNSFSIVEKILLNSKNIDHKKLHCYCYFSGMSSRIPLVKQIFDAYSKGLRPKYNTATEEIDFITYDKAAPIKLFKHNYNDIISKKGYTKASATLGAALFYANLLENPYAPNITLKGLDKRTITRIGMKEIHFINQLFIEWIPRYRKYVEEDRAVNLDENSVKSCDACEIRDYSFSFFRGKHKKKIVLYEHLRHNNNFSENDCLSIGEYILTIPNNDIEKIDGKLMIVITENYNVIVKGKINNDWIIATEIL